MVNTLKPNEQGLNRIDVVLDEGKFARIEPIVGDALLSQKVAVIGRYENARVIEYLVCCGLLSFDIVETDRDEKIKASSDSKLECAFTRIEQLRARLELDIRNSSHTSDSYSKTVESSGINLIVGTGGRKEYELTKAVAQQSGRHAIFYSMTGRGVGFVLFLLPGESLSIPEWLFNRLQGEGIEAVDLFGELHLSNIVANYAKGLLLAETEYRRPDIESMLAGGTRVLMAGHPSWPWAIVPIELSAEMPFALQNLEMVESFDLAGRTCMVIGLGSLGSIVADTLYDLGANLILIDGEEVAAANPIRQIYGFDQIGEAKARACIARLAYLQDGTWQETASDSQWLLRRGEQTLSGFKATITQDSENLTEIISLIGEHQPDVAVVATGTEHDRAISRLLRSASIPHVIVSCYARARFFEAIVVDNQDGPCFGCVRGHLYLGRQPDLTLEQRARYVSSEHDLVAEPATRIETARAADTAAHIACGLLQPRNAVWLNRALEEEQIFFLGGNNVERDGQGDPAYGIELPGQLRLFGLQDIAGRGSYVECWDCGRHLPVAIPYF
jgi:hypothetical protein